MRPKHQATKSYIYPTKIAIELLKTDFGQKEGATIRKPPLYSNYACKWFTLSRPSLYHLSKGSHTLIKMLDFVAGRNLNTDTCLTLGYY